MNNNKKTEYPSENHCNTWESTMCDKNINMY